MRKLLTAVALLAAMMPSAHAGGDTYTTARAGHWEAFQGTSDGGQSMCGMLTVINFNSGATGGMHVKYFAGNQHTTIQLMKSTWRMPTNAVNVPVVIGVDKEVLWEAEALGYAGKLMPIVEFYIKTDKFADFIEQFGAAAKFWIRFSQGSEQPWVLDMTGSRTVSKAFTNCVAATIQGGGGGGTSQPYGKPDATQPFGNQPSQPFGAGKERGA